MDTPDRTLSEELLLCPICLDLFDLPISTPCGHNFCRDCIQGYWETAELSQCPVCKQKLSRGPEFKVNTLISELTSQFKKSSEKTLERESGSVGERSSWKDLRSEHRAVDVSKESQGAEPTKKTKASATKKLLNLFSKAGAARARPAGDSINERLRWISEINQTVEISRENAAREVQDCLRVFQRWLRIVQKGQADLLEEIGAEQRRVELKARELVAGLEREIDALARNGREGSSAPPAERARLETAVYVGTMSGGVAKVAGELEETVRVEVKRLYEAEVRRARQYAVDVTLDPDTAHPKLILSDNGKEVHHSDVALSLPDSPKRFYPGLSVLGKEGFSSGRFYYEVLVRGKTEWDVGVALETVTRKGGSMLNPENGYWALGMRGERSYWALSTTPVSVPLLKELHRVGIYVDTEGGQVSFYDADAASLIYSFTGQSFGRALLPYFNPRRNQNGTNSVALIVSPVDV